MAPFITERHVVLLLVTCCVWSSAIAVQETVGHYFEAADAKQGSARGVYLVEDVMFPEAAITRVTGYCVREGVVWVQVWRPSPVPEDPEARIYTLVTQTRLTTHSLNSVCQVSFHKRGEFLMTQHGDRLGLYHESDESPLAYRMIDSHSISMYRLPVQNPDEIYVGVTVKFLDIPFPDRFSLKVSYDTEVGMYQGPGNDIVIPTTDYILTSPTIPPFPENDGTIIYVGTSLAARRSSQVESARGIYLLHSIKLRRGVVTSLYAYFSRRVPVWFQVWRPTRHEDVFTLVDQVLVPPQQHVPRAGEIRLQQYIFTEDNDVLGLMNEAGEGAVGYDFVAGDYPARPFVASLGPGLPTVGQAVPFTTFGMPYDFGIGLKYDTVVDVSKYGTPGTRTAPVITTTTTPTTTILPLPDLGKNKVIGQENIYPTIKFLPSGARKTFLIHELEFREHAVVKSFWAYFARSGRVYMQAWRRSDPNIATRFTLIGQKLYDAPDRKGLHEVQLTPGEYFRVSPGDCVGFTNVDDQGAVGHHFVASSGDRDLYYNDTVVGLRVNDSLNFDVLPFPYKFALAAVYDVDVGQTTSRTTDGSTDSTDGATKGLPGPVVVGRQMYIWVMKPQVVLALLIWLIIITLLFIILCIYVICKKTRTEYIYQRSPYSAFGDQGNPTGSHGNRPDSYTRWVGGMKDDETINYFNPTTIQAQTGVSDNKGTVSDNRRHQHANQNGNNSSRTSSAFDNPGFITQM